MIRGGEMYGYEIQRLLSSQGEKLQLSYVYKTLKEMCDEGLLQGQLREGERGPQTRQYRLTAKGRKELGKIFGEATELIHDFYEEYVAGLPPEFFSDRFQTMLREVYGGRRIVGLIISEPLTVVHREILNGLLRRKGAERTYLIKPPHIIAEVERPNLTVLDGTFDDIPMKDKSLDAMIVVDIQDATYHERCCKEFLRVLRAGGVMVACCPFVGLGGTNDPLDVGEFMKKTKFTLSGRPYLDKETIKKTLTEHFDYVDMANMGFLTAFVAGLKPIQIAA